MGVKRLVGIAVTVTVLVVPGCLWAQRGGGGHSFGGGRSSGGFGGHAAGGFSSFHSSPAPVFHQSPGSSRFGSVRQAFGSRPGPGGRNPGRPYRNRYYGYGFGYPYGYGYGFYPYGYYIPSSLSYAGFPDDYQSNQGAQAPPEDYGAPPTEAENELEGQVQQLSDEVAQMRAGGGYPPGPGYGPGPGYPGPAYGAPAPAEAEKQLSTVLVYRDGHQMEIQNYAIYGQTVWVFGDQITRKVALADLDVAKTKQLNDQRGVEFDIPESR
jgi:hypothetical protein